MDTRPCKGTHSVTYHWMPDEDPRRVAIKPCTETEFLSSAGYCNSRDCCTTCHSLDSDCVGVASNDTLLTKAMAKLFKHYQKEHGMFAFAKTHTGNGTFQGAFAFTLTKSPNDDLTEEDMIKAAMKVMGQKSNPVKRFVWYLEYADEEIRKHPHIHGMYETNDGGRVEAKHWKRAWPVWNEKLRLGAGFRGGYHRPVRAEESYLQYVAKCGDQRHDMDGIDETSCKIEDE